MTKGKGKQTEEDESVGRNESDRREGEAMETGELRKHGCSLSQVQKGLQSRPRENCKIDQGGRSALFGLSGA